MPEFQENEAATKNEFLALFPESEAYEISNLADQTYGPAMPHALKKLEVYKEQYKVVDIQYQPKWHVTLSKFAGIAFTGFALWERDVYALGIGLAGIGFGTVKGEWEKQKTVTEQRGAADARIVALGTAITELKGRLGEENA